MAYFEPNKKKVLKMIAELTYEKPYTDFPEIESHIPRKWKVDGCGTQNIVNVLVELYRGGLIKTTLGNEDSFIEGREIRGKPFFLSPKGKEELRPWLLQYWPIIVGFLVSVATIVTAVYAALEYYKK